MASPRVGDVLELTVGPVAHGGHCVARHDGQVVFVRHALPGERVRAQVTGTGKGGRFLRADSLQVLQRSPDRVEPPCPHSGPGRCGGCDWQHAALPAQRRLKAEVLRDALRHQGGVAEIAGRPVEDCVEVVAVPGDTDGLRWRSRVEYAVAVGDGGHPVVGLHRHRSGDVEAVEDCRIATGGIVDLGVPRLSVDGAVSVLTVASSTGDRLVRADPPVPARVGRALCDALPPDVAVAGARGRTWVTEQAAGRRWRVEGDGFWQVHPGAADALVGCVRELLAPRDGEHLLDLYSGVGLFAGALAADLGRGGRVDAVEASWQAVRDARRNLHDLPVVRLHEAAVGPWLARRTVRRVDLVVLDPPRAGAGAAVVRALLALRPRAVAYVACDPVSLARDLRTATETGGWVVAAVRAFDLFPMTHHLETVALLVPSGARGAGAGAAEVS